MFVPTNLSTIVATNKIYLYQRQFQLKRRNEIKSSMHLKDDMWTNTPCRAGNVMSIKDGQSGLDFHFNVNSYVKYI